MPLVGMPEYSPYRSWTGVDNRMHDSGPFAMRLRDDAVSSSSSSSNCSPEFTTTSEYVPPVGTSNSAVCSLKAPTSSAAVAPPLPTTTPAAFALNSYHQNYRQRATAGPLLQSAGDARVSAGVLEQQHHNQLQFLSSCGLLERQYSKFTMPKLANDTFHVNGSSDGYVNDPGNKQFLSYLLANSSAGIEQKLALSAFIDQMNSADTNAHRWSPMQQNFFRQQNSWPMFSQNNATRDYDPWHFQPTNGHNGNTHGVVENGGITGFPSPSALKKQQVPDALANGFTEHQNGNDTRRASFASFSSSSCYNGSLAASNSIKNGNAVDLTSAEVANDSSGLAPRSFSMTQPNGTGFAPVNSAPYQQRNQQHHSVSMGIGAPWSPMNGHHDDVFSNMNTFNARALNQTDDGREYCRPENGFSPEQSRSSGSGSGSTSGGEHAESPVQQRNTFYEPGSGMRNVPVWLKNLRLHKYEWLFSHLTYDDMMHLTVERLAHQKICEGARKKIFLSIQKLRERVPVLKQLEKELSEPGGIKPSALALKAMVDTPIRPYTGPAGRQNLVDVDQTLIDGLDVDSNSLDDENLPAHFTRVLYKTCYKVLNAPSPGVDEECVAACSFALDRSQNNDAFTVAQKRRLGSVKQQIRRLHSTMPRKLAPRSNSWNKDRRQSLGATVVAANRVSNTAGQPLHRQSSLGNNGIGMMTSCSRPVMEPTVLPSVMAQNKPAPAYNQQPINRVHVANGLAPSLKCIEKSNCSVVPSYASAVSGSVNGQRQQKSLDEEDTANSAAAQQQGRPIQRTISAPPLRPMNGNGCSNENAAGANTNGSNVNQAGASFPTALNESDGSVPAYCWPPSSVFTAGPIMPPPLSSRLGSAWSCGFEEATAARTPSYIISTPSNIDGAVWSCYTASACANLHKNVYGTAVMDSSGLAGGNQRRNKHGDQINEGGPGLFGPVVGSFGSDWNVRLDQLCRSIADSSIGGVDKDAPPHW